MPAKKYSEKFKKQVIEYAKNGSETMVDVAKKFNIPRMTLYRWLEKESENIEKVEEAQEPDKNANPEENSLKELKNTASDENIGIFETDNKPQQNQEEFEKDIAKVMSSIEQEQARGFGGNVSGRAVKTIHVNETVKSKLQQKKEETERAESSRKRRKQFKKIKQRIILLILFLVCMFEMYAYKDSIIEKLGMQISRLQGSLILEGVEHLELNNVDISFDKKTQRSTVKLKLTNISEKDLENLRYTAIFKDYNGNEIVTSTLIIRKIDSNQECNINLMVDGDVSESQSIELKQL